MDWIFSFDLFLFDFDGLLVNTEHLHYQAYRNVLSRRGIDLFLSFANFQELAHLDAGSWKNELINKIPEIADKYSQIYEEKQEELKNLFLSGRCELMPGVLQLLELLEKHQIERCVVTNSQKDQIDVVKSQLPILQTIPHWITRELYQKAKPDPECYLQAIERFGKGKKKIIGFEDSAKGIRSLSQTPALAVLIADESYPLLNAAIEKGIFYFPSFEKIPKDAFR